LRAGTGRRSRRGWSWRRGRCGSATRGLELLDQLDGEKLDGYRYFHAARADLLRRLGRDRDAADSYDRALRLCDNPAERSFLKGRLGALSPQ
jgi:predicted RNA polymerase sigma factor